MVSVRSLVAAASVLYGIVGAATTTSTSATPLCTGEFSGIATPKTGDAIVQVRDEDLDATYFEVVYCSGQYFKTRTIDASIWLTSTQSQTSGQLLAREKQPDNLDAGDDFISDSYRFNVSIAPQDGEFTTGVQRLTVYETVTGYYNPENFETSFVDLNFTVVDAV